MIQSATAQRRIALALLALAMVVSVLVLADWSRGQTFSNDELGYANRFATQSLGHVLLYPPPDKYMIAVPLLVFRAFFGIVGLDSYAPYAGLGIALNLLCGGLFYLLARRRVGDLWALPPTVLLLLFGYGWAEMSTAIPSLIALASGLGMMLALARGHLRGDLVAMALLAVSLASHPESVVFGVAAAVLIALRQAPERWRRAWVVLGPAVLYGSWWLFFRVSGDLPMRTKVDVIALFVWDSLVATVAAVTGLAGVIDSPSYDQALAQIAAAALVALIVWGVATHLRSLPPSFWATAAALVTLFVTTSFPAFRHADTPRYLYPAALLLLLTLIELAGTVHLPNWRVWAATGVLALGLAANLVRLNDAGDSGRRLATEVRANYGVTEIAARVVRRDYLPHGVYYPTAGEYLDAVHAFGSPAYSSSELTALPAPVKAAVDAVLLHEMRLHLEPIRSSAPTGARPRVDLPLQGASSRSPGCVHLRPAGNARAFAPQGGVLPPASIAGSTPPPALGELVLAPGSASITGDGGARFRLGRFAASPTVPLQMPHGTPSARLAIPEDSDSDSIPWRLVVYSRAPISVCGLP